MRRSIRNRRSRHKIKKDFELQLTSMMDMLIILLVFLLKSYTTAAAVFATSPNIKLPASTAEEIPIDATNLFIEPAGISVDGEKVVDFKIPPGMTLPAVNGAPTGPNTLTSDNATYDMDKTLMADSGRRIVPLYDALMKTKDKAVLIMSKAVWKDKDGKVTDPKFAGTLVIHADKGVRYDLLRKIMYTAGAAQYKVFKLVTVKKDT